MTNWAMTNLWHSARRGLMILFLLCGAITTVHAQETGNFCSKPLPLSDDDKATLDKISTGAGGISELVQKPFPTKTIPVLFDESYSSEEIITAPFRKAALLSRKYLGITFAICPAKEILNNTKIKGYVYITKHSSSETAAHTCWVKPAGFTPKVAPGSWFDFSRRQKLGSNATVMGIGHPDICGPDKIYAVVHEILHALGMSHQMQNPAGKGYLEFFPTPAYEKPDLSEADRQLLDFCLAQYKERPTAFWLNTYDPASIMHYSLNGKHCTFTPTPKGCGAADKPCKVQTDIVDKGTLCAYRTGADGKVISGSACFDPKKRPGPQASLPGFYGQQQCVSVVDQAWVLKAYETAPADGFDLENGGKCEIIK